MSFMLFLFILLSQRSLNLSIQLIQSERNKTEKVLGPHVNRIHFFLPRKRKEMEKKTLTKKSMSFSGLVYKGTKTAITQNTGNKIFLTW